MLANLVVLSTLFTLVSSLPWTNQLQERQAVSLPSSSSPDGGINLVTNCPLPGHFSLTFGSFLFLFCLSPLRLLNTSRRRADLHFLGTSDDGPYLWEKQVSDAFVAGNQLTTFFLNVSRFPCTRREFPCSFCYLFFFHSHLSALPAELISSSRIQGHNYGCIYDSAEVVKELFDANHTLGSHSWSHFNMGLL